MINARYMTFELRRALRNPRLLIFTMGFPIAFFCIFAVPHRHDHDFNGSGISTVIYYMVGLASWGGIGAMVSGGGRISSERVVGWNRQLRITPLSPAAYIAGKVIVAYLIALMTIACLIVGALLLGAHLDAFDTLRMLGLMVLGLLPFSMLGVALGHVITPDTIGPVMGGVMGLLPIVSGVWYPIPDHGFVHDLAINLPSYWLVQASHIEIGAAAWGTRGWVVVGIWMVVMGRLAMLAYRRDTERA